MNNCWDKNDPKAAQIVLHMLRIGATPVYADPLEAGINYLQELSKTHEVISKAKTQTWHRIVSSYLPLYFPEIAHFAGNGRSEWSLALIERFPATTSITSLGRETTVEEAWALVDCKVSKARLINDIYQTACSSVARPIADDAVTISMFRIVIGQGRSLICERNRIVQITQSLLADNQDYQLLCKIPGIGPINALTILAEAGDLRRFRHHRQFATTSSGLCRFAAISMSI